MKSRSNPFVRTAALAAFSLALSAVPAAHAATVTWTGASGADWDLGTNWSTLAKPATADTALFNLTGITSVTNATADQTVTGITFDTNIASTGTFTLGTIGGNKLTLQNGGTIQILSSLTGTGKTITVNAPLVLAGTSYTFSNANTDATNTLNFGGAITSTSGTTILTLSGANTGNNTISGNITNGASGTMGLTKSGAGTWILSGAANTYGGTTTVSAGTLALTGSLSTGGTVLVGSASGGTLNITGSFTQTAAANPRNFQITNTAGTTGTVNVSGSGSLTVTGLFFGDNGGGNSNLNVSGGTVTNSGQTWFAGTNNSLVVSGGTFNSTGTFEFGAGIASGASTITVSGTGAINAGSLTIGRTTSSTTTINLGDGTAGGSLSISGIGWLGGTNTINFNGGTLTTSGNITISPTNAATVVKSGGAFFNPTANTLTISGSLTDGGGGGGLTKNNTGTLSLTGTAANTYTGTTAVSGGVLDLGKTAGINAIAGNLSIGDGAATAGLDVVRFTTSNQIADTSVVTFNGTGTNAGILRLNNQSETLAGLSSTGGAGIVENESGSAATSTLTVSFASGTQTFDGILRNGDGVGTDGTLALSKTGAGTQVLTGSTNSYTGGTAITGGALSFANGALGTTGAITVNGGTLQWNGSNTQDISARLTLQNSGSATLDTNGNSVTLATAFGGSTSSSLTKINTGTLSLTGAAANTYTGTTAVSGGVLDLGKTAGINAIAGNLSIGDGATTAGLDVVRFTTSNQIADASVVTFNGTGTNAGILRLNNQSETLAGLSSTGGAGIVENESGSAATGTLTVSFASGTQTFSGILRNGDGTGTDGTLALTKSGAGTQELSGSNTYGGTTTVSVGTLSLSGNLTTAGQIKVNGASGTVLDITGNLTQTVGGVRSFQLGASAGNTGTVNVSGSGILTLGAGMMLGENNGGNGTLNVSGGTVTTNGETWFAGANSILNVSGGTFNASSTTRMGGGPGTTSSTLTVSGSGSYIGATLDFGTGAATATSTVNIGNGSVGGNLSLTGMSLSNAASSNTINFNGGTLTANGGITVPTQVATVVKSGGAFINVAGANTLTIGGGLTDGTGGGGLTKSGTGTLSLSGTNTYTGTTTLNQGTITFGTGTLAATTGALSVNNTNTTAAGTAAILNLSTAANTTTGSLSGSISTPLSGTNTATINTQTGRTFTVNQTANGTYAGVIAGAGSFALGSLSTNTLTLSGANTYTGATTVSSGILEVTANNALGTNAAGTSVTAGAALKLTGVSYSTTEALSINGSGISGGGALVNSGTSTFAGQVTATTSATINAGGGNLSFTGGLVKNGTVLTLTGGGVVNVGTVAISGSSSNSDLVVDGVTLNANVANTYNGPTFIRSTAIAGTGIFNANVVDALPTSLGRSAVTMDDSGLGSSQLNLSASQSIASLTGASSSTVNLGGNTLTIGTASGSTTFAGAISGSGGSLTKDGASTQVLSNNSNSYTGATNVNNGTLIVTGNISTSSLTTVSSGATLAGTGTVGSALIQGGAMLSPGLNGVVGTLSTGALTLNALSTYLYDVQSGTTSADLVNVGGTLTIGTGTILDLVQLGTYAANEKFTLFGYTGIGSGTFKDTSGNVLADGATFTDAGGIWKIDYNDTVGLNGGSGATTTSFVTITAIPEPNVAALIGGLGTLLLLRRRR